MEKITRAVALKYDRKKDNAPKVVAKGRGPLADKIIEVANEHHVPMHEDQNLIEVLEAMDVNTEIPPQLYQAVAEVLVFIYRLNGLNKNGKHEQ